MDDCTVTGNDFSTGIRRLDGLIGYLQPGDNVIWYDPSGTLAWPFSLNFLQSSHSQHKPVMYITFDTAPGELLSQLGTLADNPHLTIVDCFTWGKGKGSDELLAFYYEERQRLPGPHYQGRRGLSR